MNFNMYFRRIQFVLMNDCLTIDGIHPYYCALIVVYICRPFESIPKVTGAFDATIQIVHAPT